MMNGLPQEVVAASVSAGNGDGRRCSGARAVEPASMETVECAGG
jgi:hypothetical protein